MNKVLQHDTQPTAPNATADHAAAPALAIEHIHRSFGPVRAVEDVSLSMASGEIIALLGHSGSGKSTLLRLIAGLDRAQTGRIVIDGHDVTDPFVPPEERGVGMMFQDYALFPHLTVLANLTFGLYRLPTAEATTRARDALARIGLAQRESDYPHRLSGGEQQRVALARALLPRPKILLMDEPFSNLDRRTRERIREETSAVLRDSGTTAILVTHDAEDAMRMADRIMLMHAGRIAETGTAEELYHRPTSLLTARFFSDFNEIAGVCRSGRVTTVLGDFPSKGLAEGAPASVCIRAGDLALDLSAISGTLRGHVISRAFYGDAQVITVALEGLSTPLSVEMPLDARPEAGQAVTVSIAPDKALVFPAD